MNIVDKYKKEVIINYCVVHHPKETYTRFFNGNYKQNIYIRSGCPSFVAEKYKEHWNPYCYPKLNDIYKILDRLTYDTAIVVCEIPVFKMLYIIQSISTNDIYVIDKSGISILE